MAKEPVIAKRIGRGYRSFLQDSRISSPVFPAVYTMGCSHFLERDAITPRQSIVLNDSCFGNSIKEWLELAQQVEEGPSDLDVSGTKIVLIINIGDVHSYRIVPSVQPHELNLDDLRMFLGNLRSFSRQNGYLLQELPGNKMRAALPPPIEDVIETQTFECFITSADDDVAFVTLVDNDNEKSYMEIPRKDLIQSKTKCKPGTIFSLVFHRQGAWEKVEFIPSKQSQITKEDRLNTLTHYEDRYGDL